MFSPKTNAPKVKSEIPLLNPKASDDKEQTARLVLSKDSLQ